MKGFFLLAPLEMKLEGEYDDFDYFSSLICLYYIFNMITFNFCLTPFLYFRKQVYYIRML